MQQETDIILTLPNCLPQDTNVMFKMSPEELRQILWSYITMSEVDETFYCILEHGDGGGGEGQVKTCEYDNTDLIVTASPEQC